MAVKTLEDKLLPIGPGLGATAIRMARFRRNEGNHDLIPAASADIPARKQADFLGDQAA